MYYVKKTAALVFGSLLIGTGINGFIVPYHLVDGGILGLGLLTKYLWGFQTGVTIIALSFPIYLFAWLYFRTYFYNSIHGLLLSSFSIDVLTPLRQFFHYPILMSAVIGGILIGSGIGIMLRYKTSTGGGDLLAQFIALRIPVNVGVIIFCIDSSVILIASQIISFTAMLYSALTIAFIGLATFLWTHRLASDEV